MPTVLPIVNAARTVPIPNPSRRPRNISVIPAVTAKHVTSKIILTLTSSYLTDNQIYVQINECISRISECKENLSHG